MWTIIFCYLAFLAYDLTKASALKAYHWVRSKLGHDVDEDLELKRGLPQGGNVGDGDTNPES